MRVVQLLFGGFCMVHQSAAPYICKCVFLSNSVMLLVCSVSCRMRVPLVASIWFCCNVCGVHHQVSLQLQIKVTCSSHSLSGSVSLRFDMRPNTLCSSLHPSEPCWCTSKGKCLLLHVQSCGALPSSGQWLGHAVDTQVSSASSIL